MWVSNRSNFTFVSGAACCGCLSKFVNHVYEKPRLSPSTMRKRLRATKKRKLQEGTWEKRTPPVKGRTLPHHEKGQKIRLYRSSKRSLESWANHYGFKHLADELPLRERAAFYCKELNKIQKAGRGPFHGQPMTRLPMSKSDWPNKKYLRDLRESSPLC